VSKTNSRKSKKDLLMRGITLSNLSGGLFSMISHPYVEVHTTTEERPAVPFWFAEVVIVAGYLRDQGLLEIFASQLRLVRGRFGTYEPIDFVAVLLGYAISGERTLADFYERLAPFAPAFLALFGRAELPDRATLSRFLAAVDQECLESLRRLFQQHALSSGWTEETLGGIWDRQKRRYVVFDIDGTRQAARQRSLPCGPELPPPRRRLDAVCAPGYTGRKRGEVLRTRTTVLQMHTRQWVGTYGNKGNGDYRGELTLALQAIAAYLKLFNLEPQMALVRLDGAYGDRVVVTQIARSGVFFVTRGKAYDLLNDPQIQAALAVGPTEYRTKSHTGESYELFEGGWVTLKEGQPPVRVIVARHLLPASKKKPKVGKLVGLWVYELFLTNVSAAGFFASDVLDLYYGRGAFEAVLADEDVEQEPDRWCSYTPCGQEFWQILSQWLWNLRLQLGRQMQKEPLRQCQLAPAKQAPTPTQVTVRGDYGSWQVEEDTPVGQYTSQDFPLLDQETLRCPAGKELSRNRQQQLNPFTQWAVYRCDPSDCSRCTLRSQCLPTDAPAQEARGVSAVRFLDCTPQAVKFLPRPGRGEAIWWADVPSRSLRRTWTAHWRRQYVEVLPLAPAPERASPPPRVDRDVRAHTRLAWSDRLARNAWVGAPQFRVTVAGVSASLAAS
jgi:hypothetical protein